jgi:DNA-binding response OmpR family regulator
MKKLDIAIGARRPEPLLRATLERSGHSCAVFESTLSVLSGLRRSAFDGVIVDLDCPSIAWQQVIDRRTNALSPHFFIIVTGARPAQALEAGADDFVGKPIVADELLARLQRVTCGQAVDARAATRISLGECFLDVERGAITGRTGSAPLTSRELALAQLLFTHAGSVLSRRRLATEVWSSDEELVAHSLEQHIYQLRRKLGRVARNSLKLSSIYGGGYRLVALQSDEEAECSPA